MQLNKKEGVSLKYGCSIIKRGERWQLTIICKSLGLFLRVRLAFGNPSRDSGTVSRLFRATSETKISPQFSVMLQRLYFRRRIVYSQVSRLSLSMCDPERTVSMSIRRSELRPSGMQGISSSPSDIGSTGIDSCKVIEGVSAASPMEFTKKNIKHLQDNH